MQGSTPAYVRTRVLVWHTGHVGVKALRFVGGVEEFAGFGKAIGAPPMATGAVRWRPFARARSLRPSVDGRRAHCRHTLPYTTFCDRVLFSTSDLMHLLVPCYQSMVYKHHQPPEALYHFGSRQLQRQPPLPLTGVGASARRCLARCQSTYACSIVGNSTNTI
jgi:hypothetical protein